MKIFGLELFGKKTEVAQEVPHVGPVSPIPDSPEASQQTAQETAESKKTNEQLASALPKETPGASAQPAPGAPVKPDEKAA